MQNSDIQALFTKRKKRQNLATTFIVIMSISLLFLREVLLPYKDIVLWVIIISVVSIIVLNYFNWRCPNCDRPLGRETNMTFCKHCGVRLTEN